MRVVNLGEGLHKREIKGVDSLQKGLPKDWFAFTNLEFVVSAGTTREIDMIIITPDRIFVVDLKDWNGKIESVDGRWEKNGTDHGPSPVGKISKNARDIGTTLRPFVSKNSGGKRIPSPFVHGAIVMTGEADVSSLAPSEARMVHSLDDFLKKLKDDKKREAEFGKAHDGFYRFKLTSQDWKNRLGKFFNVRTGYFVPGRRRFGEFVSSSQSPEFSHSKGVFSEYEAVSTIANSTTATLRLWDFTKADARFQNMDARRRIAVRERRVCDFLTEIEEDFPSISLRNRAEDIEFPPDYWEVYERRNELKRLSELSAVAVTRKPLAERTELALQVISKVATLHRQNAAHLDIGDHSVWIQEPHSVRFSHFMSASIPDEETLGESRFNFLSTAMTPEDIYEAPSDGKRKDVYLLGLVVHRLLFGVNPAQDTSDGTLAWDSSVDIDGELGHLHNWLSTALEIDPSKRFASAIEALEAFVAATENNGWNTEVAKELESYGKEFKSVFDLVSSFPMTDKLADNQDKVIWRSVTDEGEFLVKLWKSNCWGDLKGNALRILSHMNNLSKLKLAEFSFIPSVRSVHWLGDHMGVVQEWLNGEALGSGMAVEGGVSREAEKIAEQLITSVLRLHEKGISHGDLKPSNLLVPEEPDQSLQLLDVFDFGHENDGELRNANYSRDGQDAFQRDCLAVAKMVLELAPNFSNVERKARVIDQVPELIDKETELVDLAKISEFFLEDKEPEISEDLIQIQVGMQGEERRTLATDEGRYYLRRLIGDNGWVGWAVRGATEQILVFLTEGQDISRAIIRPISQGQISRLRRHEMVSFVGNIEVRASSTNELSGLKELQDKYKQDLVFCDASDENNQIDLEQFDGSEETPISTEAELDALEELIAVQHGHHDLSKVSEIWTQLLEHELEQQVTAVSSGDAFVDSSDNSVRIPYEIRTGTLDFPPSDTITVEVLDKRNQEWRSVGRLDLAKTSSEILVLIDRGRRNEGAVRSPTSWISDNQSIRLKSHFEETSRVRRRAATERVLKKRSENPYLSDVFCGKIEAPMVASVPEIDFESVRAKHGLNASQMSALERALSARPVGILQGPPGTGKTKFISALVECALENGLASNVLVASQSHEAVNNAADAILSNLGETTQTKFLRVGHEGQISGRLRRYSTRSLEAQKREKFTATLETKIEIAAAMTDVELKKAREVINFELSFRPLVEKLFGLKDQRGSISGSRKEDLELEDRTLRHLNRAVSRFEPDFVRTLELENGEADFLLSVRSRVADILEIGLSKYQTLADVADLYRDFKNSVSTGKRNLDAFFAGTRQVVAGTCVGLGRSSLGLTNTPFDLVIVDEAARCSASELSVPMQAGRWVVLVGDQAQLEPLHDQGVVRGVSRKLELEEKEVQRSDFERLFQSKYGKKAASLLATQYRMLPPIGDIVSHAFYDGKLKNGRTEPILHFANKPICLDRSVYWVPTESAGISAHQRKSGTSLQNRAEADVISNILSIWSEIPELIDAIENTHLEFPIGIICMYASQRSLIKSTLAKTDIDSRLRRMIRVDTVDSYQGKQNLIVLLSLVRNNTLGPKQNGETTIREGFMSRDNRVNVAFSRAMDNLIIVGALEGWPENGPLGRVRKLFRRCEQNGTAGSASPSEIKRFVRSGLAR